jgi:ubiquitin carboxyl-terminal hydrolase 7
MLVDSDYDEKQSFNDDNDPIAIITPEEDNSMEDDRDASAEAALPLADDHEAMIKQYMPERPEYETLAEAQHTWDITNWRQLPKRTTGPVFECGGSPWRVLFFPAGNQDAENVSFYLEQGFGDEKPPEDWYACAQFMLVLSNPNDPALYVHHTANHRFTAEEGDWGFTRFAVKTRIFAANFDKHDRPLVENDCARMTAYVRVLKDPTGVLWHNFVNYDSKKETGMVGLRNQGATCYLNSLLQSLYLTGAFRKAVYQIPTDDEEERASSNSAYALQRLFYRLQTDPVAVSTAELTHSFGWESRQIFEQQDVQELSRILMEKMETRMKGTEAENALPNMFVGKMKTYLKCINVEYESSRIEDFWDLQLNVSGCKSLDDSFRDYVQVETLEGENKYQAEGFGLQDAKKGVIFTSFPNVLHLQLKRFEYDFQRDAMMKVNDRYEFPEVWDASPYLDESADKSEPYIYRLHGVLVHSGDLNAGHYYAFLKPEKDGDFFRFDDDRVTRATKREAIDDNFGGDYGAQPGQKGQNPYTRQWSTKRSNNAYMLVYVRESRVDEIILPLDAVQPPEHLPARISEERAAAERRRKEKEEAHLYMNVLVASEANFKAYRGTDLIPWTLEDIHDPATPSHHRLLRSTTVADFTTYIAQQLGVDRDLTRPWIMVNRQNGTVRPDHPLMWTDMTLQEASDKFSTRTAHFRVFMEETNRDADGQPVWLNEEAVPAAPTAVGSAPQSHKPIIVFLKHFDVDQQSLQGVGHIYMNQMDKVQDLATPILEMMGWEAGQISIELFEEIKQNYVEPMKPKQTLLASEIQDGDIICFQRHLSDEEKEAFRQTSSSVCLTAPQYYDYLLNRIFVNFTPKTVPVANLQLQNENDDKFTLALSKKDTYDAMVQKIADHLTSVNATPVDPSHIRLTTVNPQTGKPRTVVKRQQAATVNTILLGTTYGNYSYNANASSGAPDHLFYEVLDMSLADLEQRKNIRIIWLSEGITKEEPIDILAHKQAQFSTVQESLLKRLEAAATATAATPTTPDAASAPAAAAAPTAPAQPTSPPNIRFFEVHSHKIFKLLPLTHAVTGVNEFLTIYAERIPDEEYPYVQEQMLKDLGAFDGSSLPQGDRLIHCFHFEKEPSKPHGVPFVFLMKSGEVFKETKERLMKRTGIKGKNFEKIRWCVVRGATNPGRTVWVEDGTFPFFLLLFSTLSLSSSAVLFYE